MIKTKLHRLISFDVMAPRMLNLDYFDQPLFSSGTNSVWKKSPVSNCFPGNVSPIKIWPNWFTEITSHCLRSAILYLVNRRPSVRTFCQKIPGNNLSYCF